MSKLEAARRRGEVKEAHQVQTTEPGHRHKPKKKKKPKQKSKRRAKQKGKKKQNNKKKNRKNPTENRQRDVEDGLQMGTIF